MMHLLIEEVLPKILFFIINVHKIVLRIDLGSKNSRVIKSLLQKTASTLNANFFFIIKSAIFCMGYLFTTKSWEK